MLKRGVVLFLIIFITGCGFKLRGMMDMPTWLNNIAISVKDAHQDLASILKDNFQSYGINVINDPTRADYLLILERDMSQQQITSVSASTTPRQYLLNYTVIYSLLKVNGGPIITSNVISVTRQLTVNNDRILGSDAEELMIYAEMRREAVMQIINRISRKQTYTSIPGSPQTSK